jgi:hypothetical protein
MNMLRIMPTNSSKTLSRYKYPYRLIGLSILQFFNVPMIGVARTVDQLRLVEDLKSLKGHVDITPPKLSTKSLYNIGNYDSDMPPMTVTCYDNTTVFCGQLWKVASRLRSALK